MYVIKDRIQIIILFINFEMYVIKDRSRDNLYILYKKINKNIVNQRF